MGERNLIMVPGPTNVPARVMRAMIKPMINHRGSEFRTLHKGIVENLKHIFQTEGDVFILTASGTGGVERAISNIVRALDILFSRRQRLARYLNSPRTENYHKTSHRHQNVQAS